MALEDLNDKQLEAVKQIDGPLLILAGAGSGKTSTMTNRIAYMVSQGIAPYNILAVTFTNKAAQEMRDRVEALIGPQRGMWIMTFHAMCLRILHADAEKLGYKPNFVIYDTSDQKTLVKNIMKEKNISDKEFQPQAILSAISKCKESGRKPSDMHIEDMHDARSKAVAIVYAEYQKRLKANNAMDFDDLLVNTVDLFREHKDVLAKYQERFQYIMVDEYQDTNHTQYMLITMLAAKHHNLCVVGDDDQCIYEWRGADIRNILDFEKDFKETKIIKLE
ncbi:MAG: ATP-dependent helicase, partial [Coriobacteriales bacterium]